MNAETRELLERLTNLSAPYMMRSWEEDIFYELQEQAAELLAKSKTEGVTQSDD